MNDDAFLIDYVHRGNKVYIIPIEKRSILVNERRKVVVVLLQKMSDARRALIVHGEDLQVLPLFKNFLKDRQLSLAGRVPCCPKAQEHDLAPKVAQPDAVSFDVTQRKISRGSALNTLPLAGEFQRHNAPGIGGRSEGE